MKNTDYFHHTRWNIFGIHLKKVNILYVLQNTSEYEQEIPLSQTIHKYMLLNLEDIGKQNKTAHKRNNIKEAPEMQWVKHSPC